MVRVTALKLTVPARLRRHRAGETKSPNVEIRRLWPSDMEAFRDHLLRLDPLSRHERFGGGMSDDFLVHYAEQCFGQGDLVYGAFVDGHMCGAAELRSNHAIWSEQAPFGRHIHAEAAFSVEEGYRRRGIGEKLFRRIQRAAGHAVDGVIADPLRCKFDPSVVACKPGETQDCLTPVQVETARKFYEGLHDASGSALTPGGLMPARSFRGRASSCRSRVRISSSAESSLTGRSRIWLSLSVTPPGNDKNDK